MDAKVDGWSRDAARAARPWRSTRSGTTRFACSRAGSHSGEGAGADIRARAELAFKSFNERFGSPTNAIYMTSSTAKTATARSAVRDQGLSISARPSGARPAALGASARRGAAAAAHAGGPALARAGGARLQEYISALSVTPDAAYHQGTVGLAVGPLIDAWLKVHPDDRAGARGFLDGLIAGLGDFGLGTIAEVFDAEAPYTPRGCIAQAWSVAEVLRCWVKTAPEPPLTPS